jgi:hypothetical protein
MAKFRLPRKIKKKLQKDMWFYPKDEVTQTYEMIFPFESQKNYDAFKKGEVSSLLQEIKKGYKKK